MKEIYHITFPQQRMISLRNASKGERILRAGLRCVYICIGVTTQQGISHDDTDESELEAEPPRRSTRIRRKRLPEPLAVQVLFSVLPNQLSLIA